MDTLTLFLHLPAPWGAEDTDTLLDILKKNDVKATFFLCGYWVDKYPEEVKKIYNDGHDIGNHSNTHPHGSKLSLEENKENIQGSSTLVFVTPSLKRNCPFSSSVRFPSVVTSVFS